MVGGGLLFSERGQNYKDGEIELLLYEYAETIMPILVRGLKGENRG